MRKITRIILLVTSILLWVGIIIPVPVAAMTGSGTEGDPYIISDVTDLQAMCNNSPYADDAYYELGNDIDATATQTWNWDAGRGVYAGFLPRTLDEGHFDGNYYSISGLHIDRYNAGGLAVGLFSSITGTGVSVTNVCIVSAYVKGEILHDSASCDVGILAGMIARGTVDHVFTSGQAVGDADDVTGGPITTLWVGGLSGRISGNVMQVTECASVADVSGTASNEADCHVGGFAGGYYSETSGTIVQDCYARGDVDGTEPGGTTEIGGFIGRINGGECDTDNCYSTGDVDGGDLNTSGGLVGVKSGGSTCTDSFWDIETSGLGHSDCGTSKTTAQMQMQSTFTSAGWDFSTVWDMGGAVNDGYPYLQWWYNPFIWEDYEAYQVVWFQPNAIIEGTTLPNRAEEEDGIITWGANPAGITITHGVLTPEEEYDFEPFIPETLDIIDPEPGGMVGDVDLERLESNPLNLLVQTIVSVGGFTARLVWLGLAWFILIAVMIAVQLLTHHMMFTGITGFGLSALFYTMGIFPLWVVIVFGMGMVASIIYERMTVL